jgi:hypothetical protein
MNAVTDGTKLDLPPGDSPDEWAPMVFIGVRGSEERETNQNCSHSIEGWIWREFAAFLGSLAPWFMTTPQKGLLECERM